MHPYSPPHFFLFQWNEVFLLFSKGWLSHLDSKSHFPLLLLGVASAMISSLLGLIPPHLIKFPLSLTTNQLAIPSPKTVLMIFLSLNHWTFPASTFTDKMLKKFSALSVSPSHSRFCLLKPSAGPPSTEAIETSLPRLASCQVEPPLFNHPPTWISCSRYPHGSHSGSPPKYLTVKLYLFSSICSPSEHTWSTYWVLFWVPENNCSAAFWMEVWNSERMSAERLIKSE